MTNVNGTEIFFPTFMKLTDAVNGEEGIFDIITKILQLVFDNSVFLIYFLQILVALGVFLYSCLKLPRTTFYFQRILILEIIILSILMLGHQSLLQFFFSQTYNHTCVYYSQGKRKCPLVSIISSNFGMINRWILVTFSFFWIEILLLFSTRQILLNKQQITIFRTLAITFNVIGIVILCVINTIAIIFGELLFWAVSTKLFPSKEKEGIELTPIQLILELVYYDSTVILMDGIVGIVIFLFCFLLWYNIFSLKTKYRVHIPISALKFLRRIEWLSCCVPFFTFFSLFYRIASTTIRFVFETNTRENWVDSMFSFISSCCFMFIPNICMMIMTVPTSFNKNYLNNNEKYGAFGSSGGKKKSRFGFFKSSPSNGSINGPLDRSLQDQQVLYDEKRRILQPNLLGNYNENDLNDLDTISFNSAISSTSSSGGHSPSGKRNKQPQIMGPISSFLYFVYKNSPWKSKSKQNNKNYKKGGNSNTRSTKSHKKRISDLTSKMMSYYNYDPQNQNFNGGDLENAESNPANYLIGYNGYGNDNNNNYDENESNTGLEGDNFSSMPSSIANDHGGSSNNINIHVSQNSDQNNHGLIKFFQNYDPNKANNGKSIPGININDSASTINIINGGPAPLNRGGPINAGSYIGSSYAGPNGVQMIPESYQSNVNIMNYDNNNHGNNNNNNMMRSEDFGGSSVLQFAAEKYQQIFMSPPARFDDPGMRMGMVGGVSQFFRSSNSDHDGSLDAEGQGDSFSPSDENDVILGESVQ